MQSFQQIILTLKQYWAERGCIIQEPYDTEVGAGTMCPETFLRVLGPDPYRTAYVQPSRRPADGRYGDNPNRLYKHSQLQVILKPAPADVKAPESPPASPTSATLFSLSPSRPSCSSSSRPCWSASATRLTRRRSSQP